MTRASSSRNAVWASSNETRCFFRLAAAFRASHSNRRSDINYIVTTTCRGDKADLVDPGLVGRTPGISCEAPIRLASSASSLCWAAPSPSELLDGPTADHDQLAAVSKVDRTTLVAAGVRKRLQLSAVV